MDTNLTDWELITRYAESCDAHAFAELVDRHIHLIYAAAQRQVGSHADDVTQAVFLLLSQKAPRLKRHGSLVGWLYGATRLCCMNLKKTERRRQRREREASLPEEHIMEIDSIEAATDLDAGLLTLKAREREAVLLRYLQKRSLRDTGRALGISEEAARKRAERGLEKLRLFFNRRGYAMAVGGLTALLLQESAKAAPAALAHAVNTAASTGIAAAGATKIAILAKLAGKAFTATALKAAATIAAAISLIGASALVIRHLATPASASTPVHLVAEEVDEPQVPGNLAFASVELLLDAKGAELLKAASEQTPSDSTFYELRQGNAVAIRSAIKDMQSNGQLLKIGEFTNMDMRPAGVGGFGLVSLGVGGFGTPMVHNNRAIGVSTVFRKPGAFDSGMIAKPQPQGALLELKVDTAQASLQSAPLGRDGNPRPPRPNPQGVERLDKPASIHWSGTLAPGRAALLLGDFGEWNGDHLVTVRVFEIYKATNLEMRYIRHLDSSVWVDGGPTELRQIADRNLVWAARGAILPAPPVAQDPWTKRLSDGTTVHLIAVSQPRDLPLCRWTPEGQPLAMPDQSQYVSLFRTERTPQIGPADAPGFTVTLNINPHTPQPANGPLIRPQDNTRMIVPEDLNRVRIFLGVGDWKVQPIAEGETLTIGHGTITLAPVNKRPQSLTLMADGDFPPDTEIHLGVITKDQRQFMCRSYPGPWSSVWSPIGSVGGPLNVASDEIDHYAVFSRPREEVVIEGFKDNPVIGLPDKVTPQEVRAAEEKIAQREWQTQWIDYSAHLAGMKALPRDPATPVGALLLMLDKATAGDAPGLRACLSGDEQQIAAFANLITARARSLAALTKKFGEENAYRAASELHNGILPTKPELVPENWSIKGKEAYSSGIGMVLRDGTWRYSVVGSMTVAAYDEARAKEEAFIKDLEAGKFKNAGDAELSLQRWFLGVPFTLP